MGSVSGITWNRSSCSRCFLQSPYIGTDYTTGIYCSTVLEQCQLQDRLRFVQSLIWNSIKVWIVGAKMVHILVQSVYESTVMHSIFRPRYSSKTRACFQHPVLGPSSLRGLGFRVYLWFRVYPKPWRTSGKPIRSPQHLSWLSVGGFRTTITGVWIIAA